MGKTNRLRVLRAERDVTQMELARKLGWHVTNYWRLENGYREPTAKELTQLAKLLKVPEEALGFAPELVGKAS